MEDVWEAVPFDGIVLFSIDEGLWLPDRSVTRAEVLGTEVLLSVAFSTPIELAEALILPEDLADVSTVLVDT